LQWRGFVISVDNSGRFAQLCYSDLFPTVLHC
jgi:hypothetical protein